MAKHATPKRSASRRKVSPKRPRATKSMGNHAGPKRRKATAPGPASTAAGTAPHSATTATATRGSTRAGPYRAKVRAYRQGLGDCFLISLKRSQGDDYRILIDCGVVLGTPNPATTMTKVVDDVVATTGGKVDLLLATHEHWDHLSGFIQAAESFAKLSVGEVWLAWTEDPDDALAKQLGEERRGALTALQMCNSALRMANDHASGLGPLAQADIVAEMLGFFGGASGGTTKDALAKVKTMSNGRVRYCRPSDDPVHLTDPDARLYVLGPPHDEKLIRRTLPSKSSPETYGLALDGKGVMPVDVNKALASAEDDPPFGSTYTISMETARGIEFFQRRYWGMGEDAPDWRRIDIEWLDSAAELALALDSATNNTSLVLAIELQGGDVLLFVADAQVGNWESWQDISWTVDGHSVTGPDLLGRIIFYKVGHHGSHNATLRQKGLEEMTNLEIAVIPVDHAMALKKRWGRMPLEELEAALKDKTRGQVLRSDQNPATKISNVVVDSLYFEISL
jgi:beta-lactamase superfamily II metal-dependent hydrolase